MEEAGGRSGGGGDRTGKWACTGGARTGEDGGYRRGDCGRARGQGTKRGSGGVRSEEATMEETTAETVAKTYDGGGDRMECTIGRRR